MVSCGDRKAFFSLMIRYESLNEPLSLDCELQRHVQGMLVLGELKEKILAIP